MYTLPEIVEALNHTYPGTQWFLKGVTFEDLEWQDKRTVPPTKEEFNAAVQAYISNKDIINYRQLRKEAYPDLGDQLDAILKQFNYMQMNKQIDCIKDLDTIINQWLAVKEQYKKGK